MSSGESAPILEVQSLSKRFPGVRALHQVDLTLNRGEVLAVIGENGAGKSTLMKILAGVQQPDSGAIRLDGKSVTIGSVEAAMQHRIALIHQELNLADNLDVVSNIFLGRETTRLGLIARRKMEAEAKELLETIGMDVSPRAIVSTLSIGQQQMVEIAKALSIGARILIMDEPTSCLSQRETENLFRVVKDLRANGVSIVYISHRLGEVRELADRVTVLRDGKNAGELAGADINHDQMVRLMVGRDVSQFYSRQPHEAGDTILNVDNLIVPTSPQHSISFQVNRGEVVGIAGLVGAGRTELLETLFGVRQASGGTIHVGGTELRAPSPRTSIRAGMALVPEDRKLQGLILEMAIRENISLAGAWDHRRGGVFLDRRRELADTDEMIEKLNIRAPGRDQIVQYLSGGNQQKVVLGKWLALAPQVLLLDEPTRGIDVGAKHEIYQLIEQLAERGVAILFASSEMEEILGISDRVLVMHEGRIAGHLQRDQLSEESVMQLATGGTLAA